ncbi:hypothetical protein WA158_001566 [Blastocystis sp. Blastoise]
MSVVCSNSYADVEVSCETQTETVLSCENDSSVSGQENNCSCADYCLTIFDWDDTLMPSTWLVENVSDEKDLNGDVKKKLQNIEDYVYLVLSQIIQFSTVVIITNSEEGWVEYCCENFFNRLKPLMDGISIVSARTIYQDSFESPFMWKQLCFKEVISDYISFLPSQCSYSIISIGDSEQEHEALNDCKNYCDNRTFLKSIKFLENPSLYHLRRELHYLYNNFVTILENQCDLDVLLFS